MFLLQMKGKMWNKDKSNKLQILDIKDDSFDEHDMVINNATFIVLKQLFSSLKLYYYIIYLEIYKI